MQEGKRVRQPHNHRSISVGKTMNNGLSPSGLIVVFVNGIERPQDIQECMPFTVKELLAEESFLHLWDLKLDELKGV